MFVRCVLMPRRDILYIYIFTDWGTLISLEELAAITITTNVTAWASEGEFYILRATLLSELLCALHVDVIVVHF